ncbi:acyl-CoA dehydrogenase family protein [Pseudooceanicola sp.]|uniref:acyl-CoA dehydrogenase family protein n=1 Tax=Pseudooceanicola sp. TaxID=1914328 RepID=UPI0035C74157
MAVLSEEQTMLKDAARGWVAEYAPVSAFRKLRDAGETGTPAQYADMAQMGWTGIMIAEEQGGVGMGLTEMCLVLEEMGRQLVASPLWASALASATALRSLGTQDQQSTWLPKIADGSCVMTLALDEGAHHDIRDTAMTATPSAGGYTLTGTKTHVVEGMGADQLLVLARTSGTPGDADGLTLFLVPADQTDRKQLITLDKRDYARITLDAVEVLADAVIGEVGGAYAPMEQALDMARIGLAAEMLGLCNQAFDTTLDYLKQRKQFDTVLAQFQAIQHRMADLFCNMELVRSTVEHAARAVDAGADDAAEAAILAKSMANDFANLMTRQMVQLHGGIGMTDLHDAGLYLKRARALEALFGTTAWHNARFAQLHGY